MSAHPNRNKRNPSPAANPRPEVISRARELLGLTQKQAGEVVFSGERSWQDWEAGERRMHPAWWHLFQMKTDPRYMAKEIMALGPDYVDKLLPHLQRLTK